MSFCEESPVKKKRRDSKEKDKDCSRQCVIHVSVAGDKDPVCKFTTNSWKVHSFLPYNSLYIINPYQAKHIRTMPHPKVSNSGYFLLHLRVIIFLFIRLSRMLPKSEAITSWITTMMKKFLMYNCMGIIRSAIKPILTSKSYRDCWIMK